MGLGFGLDLGAVWRRYKKRADTTNGNAFAISFDDPESVLENDMTSYLGTFLYQEQDYYQPPICKASLAKTRFANGFHGRMPYFRRDRVLNLYEDNRLISRKELGLVIENLLVTGDAFVGVVYNALNQIIAMYNLPSVYMRVRPRNSKKGYRFCYVQNGEVTANFYEHEVIHIKQDDLNQSIYGIPEYFGAIQSILLNEAATLFRRKYFINGAHLGSLFLSTSNQLKAADEKLIAQRIKQSKGLGNFRSMFLHLPGMQKASDVFTVVPVGDVATRDEFEKIKNISDHDISAAWGTRPEVAGIMPNALGGTGDIDKLHWWDYETKTQPLINLVANTINKRLSTRNKLSFAQLEKVQ